MAGGSTSGYNREEYAYNSSGGSGGSSNAGGGQSGGSSQPQVFKQRMDQSCYLGP